MNESGKLVWAGNVGTDFDQRSIESLHKRLKPLMTSRSPCAEPPRMARRVTWVKPALAAMIKFANWTRDGKLRAPVCRGLRRDVKPEDVVREIAANGRQ